MTKNVLSGQRLVLLICGLSSDFADAKGMHQACAISDLRALPAGLPKSTVNIIGELFYRMNFGFCEAETQTWNILIMKPTRCTNFSNLFLDWTSTTCFGQFLCPS
jgi:hypothetical protein